MAGAALPASVFAAYRHAEAELARTAPGCRLRWQLLAAIGQVESGQARGGRVTADGTTVAPILGPRLDGGAFAVVRDTDGGAYDGDPAELDRAVLGYNHSEAYLHTVRAWYAYFLEGHRVVPDSSAKASTRPEPSPPKPTPKPTPSPHPRASPSRTPSAPASPAPTRSRPAGGAEGTEEPQLPPPGTDIELPGDDLLTSNGVDSMTSSPSTTADTGR